MVLYGLSWWEVLLGCRIVIGEWWLQGEGQKSQSLHRFEYIVRKTDSQHCTVRTSETDCYLFNVVSHVSDTYDTDVLSSNSLCTHWQRPFTHISKAWHYWGKQMVCHKFWFLWAFHTPWIQRIQIIDCRGYLVSKLQLKSGFVLTVWLVMTPLRISCT
jgi:hypothetical protein